MRKRAYVSYLLFPQVFSRLLLVWLCTAIASGALFLVATMIVNQKAAQNTVTSMQLNHTAFFSDILANRFSGNQREDLVAKRDAALQSLPGLTNIHEQISLRGFLNESATMQLIVYPSAIIERAQFLPKPALPLETDDSPPIWLDANLADTIAIGETVSLSLLYNDQLNLHSFTVVGYLDERNTHLDIGHVASSDVITMQNIVSYHPSVITAVTAQEPLFLSDTFAEHASSTKMLLYEPGTDLSSWKQTIIENGLGTFFIMDEMIQTENEQLSLGMMIYLSIGAGLLLLTLLGLGNVQYLLMRRCQHMAAILRSCGMEWSHWQTSWMLLLGGLLIFPCTVGCAVGVLLQDIYHSNDTLVLWWLIIPIFLFIFVLTILSLYPLLYRWKRQSIVSVLYPSSQN